MTTQPDLTDSENHQAAPNALAPVHAQSEITPLPLLRLPGINPETVQLAGLQHVDANTALQLTGIDTPGLLIPYRTITGLMVMDGGVPFFRLRLDHPRGSQKYHQRFDSSPHAYIPPHNVGSDRFEEIILVEGEKKALALSDTGKIAFGISGFYGAATRANDDRWVPVPELEEIRRICPPEKIYLAGDQDTLFNGQFYDAAIKLREAFPGASLHCLQVPANAPGKGFDDCRAVMEPAAFEAILQQAEAKAQKVEVTDKSTVGSLALNSLRAEWPAMIAAFRKGSAEEQTVLRDNLVKLAASLRVFNCDLDADEVVKFAVDECGYARRAFNNAVNHRQQRIAREAQSDLDQGNGKQIIRTEQQGVWATEAAAVLGQLIFWHGNKFASVIGGEISHFTGHQVATYLDHPDKCRFLRKNSDGMLQPLTLTANDADYVTAAASIDPSIVRPIEVLSSMPALVWRPPGYEVVSGYDLESKIYASGSLPELPSLEDAKVTLMKVLGDFRFSDDYEKARCIAFLLTPAIVRSGALGGGRCPLFLVSKDQKGAGGGYLVNLVASVYGMKPGAVVPSQNQPERSKEGVSAYLVRGNHFIYFDNVRGDALTRLAFLESLLTEPRFEARAPYMQALVDVRREVFACTSNGTIMSDDLADRTLEIRILRQPLGYEFTDWPEGDLMAHVEANRAKILAAIYALVNCYDEEAKKSRLKLRGFRFREWEHGLTWIITNLFPELPGLLEDNYRQRKSVELTDPNYGTLVEILRAAATDMPDNPCSTSSLVTLAVEKQITLRGDRPELELGKLMTRHFPYTGEHQFAGRFRVVRTERQTQTSNGNQVKFYSVTFLGAPESPGRSTTGTGPSKTASTSRPAQNSASFTLGSMEGQKPVFNVGSVEPQHSTILASVEVPPPMPPATFNATQPPSPAMPPPQPHRRPPPLPVMTPQQPQKRMPPPLPPRMAPPPPLPMPQEAPEGWFKQPVTPTSVPERRPPPPPPPPPQQA
jgi:hypothetical protein